MVAAFSCHAIERYNKFVTTVETSKDRFNGRIRLGYSGVQLYLTGAF